MSRGHVLKVLESSISLPKMLHQKLSVASRIKESFHWGKLSPVSLQQTLVS